MLNAEHVGVIADFGSSGDDQRENIEQEDATVTYFVRCHPMPSLDDEEGDVFWHKVFDRLTNKQGVIG